MFEDFENRMGFWKNLGSNFTISYSGDEPSFMSDGELWASIGPNAGTQTLAEWEDGYVLINNPDGTITANPKYTSGLDPETLVRVPVGPQSPTAMFPSTGGGVVVTGYGAENKIFQASDTLPCLQDIFTNGHPFFKEISFGGGNYQIGFLDNNIMQVVNQGDLAGQVLRIIPADGYDIHWTAVNSSSPNHKDEWSGGIGKNFGSSPVTWYKYTAKKMVEKATGKEYTFGGCGTPSSPSGTGGGTTPSGSTGSGTGGSGSGTGGSGSGGTGGSGETDPNDCASENRELNTDDTCGDCLSGYTEDTDGDCIADEPEEEEKGVNWLLWGGIAAVAAFAFMG